MTADKKPRTLKDQLESKISDMERSAAEDPERYNGGDWWQLSDDEEAVFAIDRERFPRMITTWHCYDAFKRIASDGFDDDLIEQARRQHSKWCGEGTSPIEFFAFAKAFGGLTYREAHAIYAKHDFWCVRNGITRYHDE